MSSAWGDPRRPIVERLTGEIGVGEDRGAFGPGRGRMSATIVRVDGEPFVSLTGSTRGLTSGTVRLTPEDWRRLARGVDAALREAGL